MPVFSYEAIDARSHRVRGAIEAQSRRRARRLLLSRGIRAASLDEESHPSSGSRAPVLAALVARLRATTQRERVVDSFENVITMLQSGLTLEAAWSGIVPPGGAQATGTVFHRLHDAVAQGRPLADAMREHPLYFDKVDVALTLAGEDAGELAAALERLVARRRLAGKLSSTLLSAMAYPAFLAFFGC